MGFLSTALVLVLPFQGNLPKGQETVPDFKRDPPCPYLRIQKKDTSTDDPKEEAKLAEDVLGKPQAELTDKEKETYKRCLSVMDDVSEENMDMLEHIGEFLGRYFTGQPLGGKAAGRNLLKDYVRAYVLAPK